MTHQVNRNTSGPAAFKARANYHPDNNYVPSIRMIDNRLRYMIYIKGVEQGGYCDSHKEAVSLAREMDK